MIINIPNILTILRVGAIPCLVLFFFMPFQWSKWVAAIIFGIAAITDYLDGFLARKFNQHTALGEFLDPVADKLLVVVTLLLLISREQILLYLFPATVIICREIIISALREWMAEIGKRSNVAVNYLGKLKTVMQMFALPFLITDYNFLFVIGAILLYLSVILTLWSMVSYLKLAWPYLTTNTKTS